MTCCLSLWNRTVWPGLRARLNIILSQVQHRGCKHINCIKMTSAVFFFCVVSEITMFYCQLDMTSSSVLRQGTLHAIFHDGFCKSDHDFPIAFHSKLLSGMHGFQDNEILLHTGYDVIVIYPLGSVSGDFSWRILKKRPWLPVSC